MDRQSFAIIALSLAASFGIGGSAEAREAVITSYELTQAPSEKIPAGTTLHIEGFAEVIAQGCEASRAKAKLVLEERDGKVVISADVSPLLIARRLPCVELPAEFKGLRFSADFDLSPDQLAKTELLNVKAFGGRVHLQDLVLPEPGDEASQSTGCESIGFYDVMCTMEYKPTTCRYGEVSLSAGNLCVARGKIQKKICESEGLFAPEELTCSSGEAI